MQNNKTGDYSDKDENVKEKKHNKKSWIVK